MDGTIPNEVRRRKLLGLLGAVGGAGLAGCSGNGDGTPTAGGTPDGGGNGGTPSNGTGGSDFLSAAQELGLTENWRERRETTLDEWPLEQRQATPSSDNHGSIDAWKNSESVQSAPWEPPSGWDDTAAGDVDTLQFLNFGGLGFDPATAARFAAFENKTGINLDVLEIPSAQNIPKQAAFLAAGESQPHAFLVNVNATFAPFAGNGYLEVADPVFGSDEMWEPFFEPTQSTFSYQGNLYLTPMMSQGSMLHMRLDLLRDQGISEDLIQQFIDGNHTWDHLEQVMQAFEGTDVSGFAYRAGSRTMAVRDFLKAFYQAGGQIVQDDGTVVYNSEPAQVALQKWIDWRDNGWVPESVINFGQGNLADGLLSGQIAIVSVAGDLVTDGVNQHGDNYHPAVELAGAPPAPNPTRAGSAGPIGLGINANAPLGHKLASTLLMDLKASLQNNWWEFVYEGNNPYHAPTYTQAGETGAAFHTDVRIEAGQYVISESHRQSRLIRGELATAIQRALAGEVEPMAALDQVQSFVDTVLGQN